MIREQYAESEFWLYSQPTGFYRCQCPTLIHLISSATVHFTFWLRKQEISVRKQMGTYVKAANNQPVKFTNHLFKSKITNDEDQWLLSGVATLNRENLTDVNTVDVTYRWLRRHFNRHVVEARPSAAAAEPLTAAVQNRNSHFPFHRITSKTNSNQVIGRHERGSLSLWGGSLDYLVLKAIVFAKKIPFVLKVKVSFSTTVVLHWAQGTRGFNIANIDKVRSYDVHCISKWFCAVMHDLQWGWRTFHKKLSSHLSSISFGIMLRIMWESLCNHGLSVI